MWKRAVVFISVLAVAAAYVALAKLEPKPDKFKNEEGCYISLLDQVIPFGKTGGRAPRDKELCEMFRCEKDWVQIVGCGKILAPPSCRLQESRDKPYPDCCPALDCPVNQH